MSEQGFNSEEGKEKIVTGNTINKENNPKTMHTIMSIIYIAAIVLSSPLIIWSFAYDYQAAIPVVLIIGCIIVSRILINKNKLLPLAHILLFIPLILILLVLSAGIITVPVILIACIYYAIKLFRKNNSLLHREEQNISPVAAEILVEIKKNKTMAYLILVFGLVIFMAFLAQFIRLYFFDV